MESKKKEIAQHPTSVEPTIYWLEIWRSTIMLGHNSLVKKLYLTEEALPNKIMRPCQLRHAVRAIVSPPQV